MCVRFWVLSCRGNSKYHYYGIRVKPDSPLNRLQEDMQYMALRQQPVQQKQRYHRKLGLHTNVQYLLWHKLPFFKTLRWAIWFQVQACAEVWCLLWGELLRWRPATSWCSRADGHCTEPTPPAVPRSVAFLYIWMSVKTKNTRDALKYSDECSVFRLFHSGNFIALIYFLFPQQMHRGHSLTL